ncbi:MAG: hypothetical protein E7164_02925 [Firmicutes bacterium]|nr:hypothetical protein [Bacillota bacterium]
MEKYEKVPDIITGKDLEYLQDMFNWNYGAYKNTVEAIELVEDEKISKHLQKAAKEFYTIMSEILDILQGGANENSK